jgi:hypothetical protein
MYYILNETDQIIAADDNLLTLCNVNDISGLSSKVTQSDTTFATPDEVNVTIETNDLEQTYSISKIALTSIDGNMTLVKLGEVQSEKELITAFESDDDLFEINDTVEEESIEEVEKPDDEEEIFDLLGESTQSTESYIAVDVNDVSEIVVDVTTTSKHIGISDEDYTVFLNEYIDTALALEEDLQSDDTDTRNNAINTLSDLSEIMHLPEISSIIESINTSTPAQQRGYTGFLYTTLSRLTTQSSANETIAIELFDDAEETPSKIGAKPKGVINPNGFGTIDLSDVKAKHFDFQLEEAANDLSLPVELIEEFVHDFIEQAHIETKKMLEAYADGDLAKIQGIGHLLKGASSNLRINALSDTLYKIQFCENENGLDDLIKEYWAHFLSFETQINIRSN